MPERIQRSRAKGWRMPEGAVYVGRPSKWGNPYRVGPEYTFHAYLQVADRGVAVRLYRRKPPQAAILDIEELRGKALACWCPLDQPCHADVLLEWANQEATR